MHLNILNSNYNNCIPKVCGIPLVNNDLANNLILGWLFSNNCLKIKSAYDSFCCRQILVYLHSNLKF